MTHQYNDRTQTKWFINTVTLYRYHKFSDNIEIANKSSFEINNKFLKNFFFKSNCGSINLRLITISTNNLIKKESQLKWC